MLLTRTLARSAARSATIAVLLSAGRGSLAAQARPDSAGAALAAVRRLLDAMTARDTGAARALLLPGARFRAVPGDSGAAAPRTEGDSAFVRRLAAGKEHLLERIWAPLVRLEGPLATVWAPYDFHVDGRWSHCGVDAFTLVRTEQGWRVSGIDYTVRRRGCAPSPLGAPAPNGVAEPSGKRDAVPRSDG